MKRVPRVAVIGAGLGGLSTAIRLACSGNSVAVFEQQSFTGGKAGSIWIRDYRFDTGPSLLTMQIVFEQLFEEAGENLYSQIPVTRLNPLCTYFYPDGTNIHSYSDAARFAQTIQAEGLARSVDLDRYLAYCRKIYDTAADLFLWKSLHEISTYTNYKTFLSLLRIGSIDSLRNMNQANESFFMDPRLVQLFNRYATYNGSSPYLVPATFNLIPHVEYGLGGFGADRGIYSIPQALTHLAQKHGVHFHLNARVQRIATNGNIVKGVVVDGRILPFDVVVSNADVLYTYRHLLADPANRWAKRYSSLEPSTSGYVLYWGINRRFPELGLHNIFFSSNYRKEFEDIFVRGVVPDEPTIYVNITSKLTPEDAPKNCENWFVLLNVPPNRGQPWARDSGAIRERVLRKLDFHLRTCVSEAIEVEEIMTPSDIEKNTNCSFGSLYGISSNSRLAAFRRHPNRSPQYRGLYFCGGSVHPGGGMPLAVLSGKITSDLIKKYET